MWPHSSKRLVHGVATLLVLMAQVAYAIPFHYSEAISGDLAQSPTTAFSLGSGDNTVSGSMYFGVNVPNHPHYDVDFDGFAFSLPASSRLDSIVLTFAVTFSNTVSAYANELLCSGVGPCSENELGDETVSYFDAPHAIYFGSVLPLPDATYSLIAKALGIGPVIDPSLPEWWSVDYAWTLQVSAVPEPGLLPLLGLALVGLICHRRKRWHSRTS